MVLRLAEETDIPNVVRMYEEAKGQSFCTWDEWYPSLETALEDWEHGCLYVLEDGETLGAVSVIGENELEQLSCWSKANRPAEIARVVIAGEHRGKGLSRVMVNQIGEILKAQGHDMVRLLAAKINVPAYRAYMSCGYRVVGSCFEYGNDYFCCEKAL